MQFTSLLQSLLLAFLLTVNVAAMYVSPSNKCHSNNLRIIPKPPCESPVAYRQNNSNNTKAAPTNTAPPGANGELQWKNSTVTYPWMVNSTATTTGIGATKTLITGHRPQVTGTGTYVNAGSGKKMWEAGPSLIWGLGMMVIVCGY
jgi:hypothetical protein